MEKIDQTTLVIKHLPHELKSEDRTDLLRKLGALNVTSVISEAKKSSLTFAKFRTKLEAHAVLKNLHQRELLGQLLSVEFAKSKDFSTNVQSFQAVNKGSQGICGVNSETTSQRKIVEAYLRRLNSWTNDLDFNKPPPSHIRYNYPPPTVQVLRNICKALAAVPKLYTQVLHLMNKMNLPCPFSERFNVETDLVGDDFENVDVPREETEESEIESVDDERETDLIIQRSKRKLPQKKVKIQIPKLTKPKVVEKLPSMKREEIFEKSEVQTLKRIELNVSSDLSSLQNLPDQFEEGESFEKMELPRTMDHPLKTETLREDGKDEHQSTEGCVSAEELELNRIQSKDFHLLPVFKNYSPGPPSCRLYIKNVSKTVQASDLEFIFNRYRVEERGDQVNLFDIRLMQEGRMKGQAFVTLQNVKLAEQAVKEVNGYILKGKAMVVQFARSSKPK